MGLALRVLLGLGAGLTVGGVVGLWGHPWAVASVEWVRPLGQLWVNAIRMTVIPLVVGLLVVGVASVRDIAALGRVGGQALLLFGASVVLSSTLAVAVAAPVLARLRIDAAATAGLRAQAGVGEPTSAELSLSLSDWVIGLIPVNPVAAAADGSLLPLIVFTIAFGTATSQIPEVLRLQVVGFFEGVVEAMLTLVRWILEAAPIGVFALALPLSLNLGIGAAGALLTYIALVAALCVLIMGLLYPVGAILGKTGFQQFARAAAPAQGVGFSARSSLAALPLLIENAGATLRLPSTVGGVFLPFAVSIFRITAPVGIVVGTLFLAQLYGVNLETTQLVSVGALAALLSFTVPGIPGGSILIMVPALLAAGVPVEGVGILLAVDTIPDMFRTAGNVTAHMALATLLGRTSGPAEENGG